MVLPIWGFRHSARLGGGENNGTYMLYSGTGDWRIVYGTFRLNFHRFDRFEPGLRGHTHVRGAAFSCLRLNRPISC